MTMFSSETRMVDRVQSMKFFSSSKKMLTYSLALSVEQSRASASSLSSHSVKWFDQSGTWSYDKTAGISLAGHADAPFW